MIVDGNGNYLGDTLTPRTFETAIKFNSALEAETFLKYSTSHLNYIGSLMMTTSFFSINEIITTDTSVRDFQVPALLRYSTFLVVNIFHQVKTLTYHSKTCWSDIFSPSYGMDL